MVFTTLKQELHAGLAGVARNHSGQCLDATVKRFTCRSALETEPWLSDIPARWAEHRGWLQLTLEVDSKIV